MQTIETFLTVAEAAGLLRTTPTALYSQRHRGEQPGTLGVKVGARILWRRDDLDHWFEDRFEAQQVGGVA